MLHNNRNYGLCMSADTFNQVLDLVESMSDEEQMILIDLIHKRRAERKRDEIAVNIAIAT